MIETSSVPPQKSSENVRKMFRNVRLTLGTILENLRKSSESGQKSYVINRILMPACEYEFYLWVFNSTSHSFAALTHEISSWTLKGNIHIYLRLCNILYVSFSAELYKWLLSEVVSVADYSVKMFLRIKISWLVPRNVQNVLYLLKAAHSCRLRHGW